MNGISIIICCYNSGEKIIQTLKSISGVILVDGVLAEIVLVDNASEDDTSLMASSYWEKYGNKNIKYKSVSEKRQGLAYARRKGVYEAKYDILIFCDDDNWLDPSYLVNAWEIMTKNKKIGVLGGDSLPYSDIGIPSWFYSYANGFAVGSQSMNSGNINSRGYVWGAGAVMRKEVLLKVYDQNIDPLLIGRKSGVLLAGDDSELCKWFILAGYDLWYSDKLKIMHFMPDVRLEKENLVRMIKGFKMSEPFLRVYDLMIILRGKGDLDFVKKIYKFIMGFYCYIKLSAEERKRIKKIVKVLG